MAYNITAALQEMREASEIKVCKYHPKVALDDQGKCAKCDAGESADDIEDKEPTQETAEDFLGSFITEMNDNQDVNNVHLPDIGGSKSLVRWRQDVRTLIEEAHTHISSGSASVDFLKSKLKNAFQILEALDDAGFEQI